MLQTFAAKIHFFFGIKQLNSKLMMKKTQPLKIACRVVLKKKCIFAPVKLW